MAARLRRLEGMVRDMITEEGGTNSVSADPGLKRSPASDHPTSSAQETAPEDRRVSFEQEHDEMDMGEEGLVDGEAAVDVGRAEQTRDTPAGGKVVPSTGSRGGGTAYVGATHFMAMLDDVGDILLFSSMPLLLIIISGLMKLHIPWLTLERRAHQIEDLKSYFNDEVTAEDSSTDTTADFDSPAMLMMDSFSPRSRDDLLALLPPKNVADRLVMRYFGSNSASQRTMVCYRGAPARVDVLLKIN